jgi:hypothetical protein
MRRGDSKFPIRQRKSPRNQAKNPVKIMANKPKIKPRKITEFEYILPPFEQAIFNPTHGKSYPSHRWGVREKMRLFLESFAQVDEESLDCIIESARIEKNEREINGREGGRRVSCRKWDSAAIILPSYLKWRACLDHPPQP